MKPTQLLQNIARVKGYPPPILSENGRRINYGKRDYTLEEFGEFILAGLLNFTDNFIPFLTGQIQITLLIKLFFY